MIALLQIVTCPQCGSESRLNSNEIVGPDIMMECGSHNCRKMFFASAENTQTFSWDGKELKPAEFPKATGPTDEELRKA